MTYKESFSHIAVTPGEAIEDMMDTKDISHADMAKKLDMTLQAFEYLLNGDMPITLDIAEKLEKHLGANAGFWLRLESIYQEDLAKVNQENLIPAYETI